MIRVCHVLDHAARWEHRVALRQLLDRLAPGAFAQQLVALHPGACETLNLGRSTVELELLPRLARLHWAAAPLLARSTRRSGVDLFHAWGIQAALTATTASRAPLVLQLFDPRLTSWQVRTVRTIARASGFAIVCSAAVIRRRLIEGGVAPEVCVVIRPGVDFAAISRERRGSLRGDLGLSPGDFAVLTPEPAVRDSGAFETFWAGELATFTGPAFRVIVPGDSREVDRIRRFAAALPRPDVVVTPGRLPFENLAAIADALIVAPRGNASTTAIAWSMAAGAAIIGVADYAVAELVAHKINGLLFKPVAGESRAMAIVRLLSDRASHDKTRETARGQAYEVFGLRRCIDQHAQVYRNVLEGNAPGQGIADSALSV